MLATINLQPVEFTEGETILEVARRTGTFIPTLCEFAALNHRPGTCRMCLVEVTRADGTSRVVTACETRLVEGDAVDTLLAQGPPHAEAPGGAPLLGPLRDLLGLRAPRRLRAAEGRPRRGP